MSTKCYHSGLPMSMCAHCQNVGPFVVEPPNVYAVKPREKRGEHLEPPQHIVAPSLSAILAINTQTHDEVRIGDQHVPVLVRVGFERIVVPTLHPTHGQDDDARRWDNMRGRSQWALDNALRTLARK